MRVVFRTDSSHHIGTGHVMRCLSLAKTFAAFNVECAFVCRNHEGHLIDLISAAGFYVYALSKHSSDSASSTLDLQHSHWLGCSQQDDARETITAIEGFTPDIIVVDHYALDYRWETSVKQSISAAFVILDDLCDRYHDCDVLIDPTFCRQDDEYKKWVNRGCHLLIGSEYAFIRDEFIVLKDRARQKRQCFTQVNHILITMGGVDENNYTDKVLSCLSQMRLDDNCEITVVLGKKSPFITYFQNSSKPHHSNVNFIVNAGNMAELMYSADIAIGAIGGTTWERCVLALPTVNIAIADNQQYVAAKLKSEGMQVLNGADFSFNDFAYSFMTVIEQYAAQVEISTRICRANGLSEIYHTILALIKGKS